MLESDCSTIASWHPQYSGGWAGGYCDFVIDCDSPGYSSELSCVRVFHLLFELLPLRIILTLKLSNACNLSANRLTQAR